MSARGTIAYICSRGGLWYLAASQQIPYDMGPDMHDGKELLKCFKEFFYSKRKHCSGERKMHSLLNAFVKKTNIEIDGTFFKYHELPQNSDRTKTIIDLQSKKDSRGNFNLENDFLANALHYSDWIYLMPLCPMTNFQFKCEADDPNWHGEGTWPKYTINSLHEGSVQIFHFRDFKYSYDGNELTEYDVFGMGHPVKGKNFSITDDSPILVAAPKEEISETDGKRFDKYGAEIDKDGNYVDERDAEYKHEYRELPLNEDDPTSEELLDDIFDDKPVGAPPLNTNVLPQKRFVEILTQYKDGDRYCLVVRDSDNKHVIFKEMK